MIVNWTHKVLYSGGGGEIPLAKIGSNLFITNNFAYIYICLYRGSGSKVGYVLVKENRLFYAKKT